MTLLVLNNWAQIQHMSFWNIFLIFPSGGNLHEMSGENKKNVIKLSAELAEKVVKV